MTETLNIKVLKTRVEEQINKTLDETITLIEDELEDIVCEIFKESKMDLDKEMEGNAKILYKKNGGFMIMMDDGNKIFMYEKAYKGSCIEEGTRIQCGKFKMTQKGLVCIDAQECLSMNELKYRMFTYIEERNMVMASSAAWAIYKDASEDNREKMKFCIHTLRDYIKYITKSIAC